MNNKIKGKRTPTTSENIEQRFWDKVEKTNTCWLWIGYKMKSGHGQFQTLEKVDYAYRYSWLLHYGDIPKGMYVCHKCDNGSCVNPEHLFLGTQKDNVHDMQRKNRSAKYKLSFEIAEEIRKKYIPRKYTLKMLSNEYNVSMMNITRILNNVIWNRPLNEI